jgi:Na+-translocating ferredoxin:NAD+ oxidoreductase RnfE subunit
MPIMPVQATGAQVIVVLLVVTLTGPTPLLAIQSSSGEALTTTIARILEVEAVAAIAVQTLAVVRPVFIFVPVFVIVQTSVLRPT